MRIKEVAERNVENSIAGYSEIKRINERILEARDKLELREILLEYLELIKNSNDIDKFDKMSYLGMRNFEEYVRQTKQMRYIIEKTLREL